MKTKKKVVQVKERVLVADERETICTISDADDNWVICTASPKYKNKFTRLGWTGKPLPGIYGYMEFQVPERCVTFRTLVKKKVSQAAIDAMLKARLKSASNVV